MGVIYKARQESLNRLVALKVLAPSLCNNLEFAERFRQEARSIARLSHPHIVPVHSISEQ